MFRFRKGKIREATIFGVIADARGGDPRRRPFAESSFGHYLVLSRHQVTIALAIYAFSASVLPMWMLLTPRDYLSTYMKIGTIAFLAIGVVIVNPDAAGAGLFRRSPAAAARSSPARSSRSSSSRSPAGPSPASMR